ncbi:2-oxo-4-hydroxy-4-carboxy-5-ureidoimidazoline decarboxylase [Actinomadura sp. NPDC047616]|uniref:2-oxo-4-hydroxy-4-carboxy-5-ureidoimidazoline decarboxylase n=1 Tax=Actinomadura sp. NPDC047616 TaxID=3155914 RepID=UPI0033C18E4C
MTLDEFNAAPERALADHLRACCDVPRWVAAVSGGRPYPDTETLLDTADRAARDLTPAEVDRALAAHPRIGERARGDDASAAWSRREQAGVDRDTVTVAALAEGNRAYEERFGRVFLICATGRSGAQILAELRARLRNDPATEAAVVAGELRKIALLRLAGLVGANTATPNQPAAAHQATNTATQ